MDANNPRLRISKKLDVKVFISARAIRIQSACHLTWWWKQLLCRRLPVPGHTSSLDREARHAGGYSDLVARSALLTGSLATITGLSEIDKHTAPCFHSTLVLCPFTS